MTMQLGLLDQPVVDNNDPEEQAVDEHNDEFDCKLKPYSHSF